MPQGPINVINQKSTINGNSYANYSATNAGSLIKTGAGVLRGISVNTAGATATLSLYDGTSAAGAALGVWSLNAQYNATDLNLQFSTGLFAVITGGTPANLTITYN